MLQQLILSVFLLVIAFLQPTYPSLENLPPITVQNAASLTQIAAIGSDTLVQTLWSPDGQTLAVITSGQVMLHNVDDLKTAFRTIPHRPDEKVSFAVDGHLVIGNVIWDIQKGTSEAQSTEFFQRSPSEKFEVTSTTDDKQTTVTITDSRRAKTTPLLTGIIGTLEQVVFSPDEQYGVVKLHVPGDGYDAYDVAQLWNIKSGTLVATLEQALEKIELITFHANGRLLVTTSTTDAIYGGPFEDVRVWDGHTGFRLNSSDQTNLLPVRFSPNKQLMVYALPDGLSLWSDYEIGKLSYQYQSPSSDYKVYAQPEKPLFSPDGKSLLAINERQIMVWDTNAAKRLGEPRLILDNGYPVSDYFFNQKGNWLIVLTRDNKIRVWDFTKRNPVIIQVFNDVSQGQISPDSKWIWGYSESTRNRVLIDAATGEILQTLSSSTQIDPQWKYAAYWSEGTMTLLDLSQNELYHLNVLPDFLGSAHYFAVGEGQAAFTGGRAIKVYDLLSGKGIFGYEDTNRVGTYTVSHDSKLLLSVSENSGSSNTVEVRQTDDLNKLLFHLELSGGNGHFLLLPDGKTLAATTVYGTSYGENAAFTTHSQFTLWDVAARAQRAEHSLVGNIQAVAINETGSLIALGTIEGFDTASMHLGDLTHPQESFLSFELSTFDRPVFDQLQFSPNGLYLAATIDNQSYGDGPIGHSYFTYIFDIKQLQAQPKAQADNLFVIQGGRLPLFSPNNQFILVNQSVYDVVNPNKTVFELWSIEIMTNLSSVAGDGAAFSPDAALLAVHDHDHTLILSVSALASGGASPLVTIPDNGGQVKDLAFSADGKRLYLIEESRVRVYGIQ